MSAEFADVLIVFGQGTYRGGEYSAELPDRDVYAGHAAAVGDVASTFNYSQIVCSGGRTQRTMRDRSEAKSFLELWCDLNATPAAAHGIALDEHALDSAESVYLGLMAARLALGTLPMRRIGVFLAWEFKKARVTHAAGDLGIATRFYFHGFAPAARSIVGDQLLARERDFLDRIEASRDCLLLSDRYDETRRRRYCGDPDEPGYEGRLHHFPRRLDTLRERFREVFECLDRVRANRSTDSLADLQRTFGEHVVRADV